MFFGNYSSGEKQMSIYVSEDIKRYKVGSIDYNYYSLKGQSARNKEIDTLLNMFWNSLKRITKRQPAYRKVASVDVTKLNYSSSKSLNFE